MTLSEMRQLLAERGIQLTRSLGQNFLHDQNQLRRIVAAGELTERDQVLEIGPGLGPLTERLLDKAGEVLAIEKDARLVRILEERFATGLVNQRSSAEVSEFARGIATQRRPILQLIHADALEYLRQEPRDWSGWKLVSNLPYSVASPLLVELAQAPRRPERIVATLQIEVARRLRAAAGDPDYGLLTLLIHLHYQPVDWFKISAACFFPEPDVDSACVCLVRRPEPLLTPDEQRAFVNIARLAFSQRRKMMLKLLKRRWPEQTLRMAFGTVAITLQSRAETVSLEQFVRLAKLLGPDSSHE